MSNVDKRDIINPWTTKQAARLLHDLSPCNSEHIKVYRKVLYYLIGAHEKRYEYAYDDQDYKWPRRRINQLQKVRGNITVGIGFFMNQCGGRRIWREAFDDKVSFDAVLSGKEALTEEQIDILYNTCINEKERVLANFYKPIWEKIRLNERASLVDLAFQSGFTHLKRDTTIHKNMLLYYETGQSNYLEQVILAIEKLYDRAKGGVKVRRKMELELFVFSKYAAITCA